MKQPPPEMLLLQKECPLLFDLLVEINDLTSEKQDLLRKLLEIFAAPFRVNCSPVDPSGSEDSAIVDGLTYFPSLPVATVLFPLVSFLVLFRVS